MQFQGLPIKKKQGLDIDSVHGDRRIDWLISR